MIPPQLSDIEILTDRDLCFWFFSRMMPGMPPVYRSLYEVPIAVFLAAGYLDHALSIARKTV